MNKGKVICNGQVKVTGKIGQGAFAKVYKGVYEGKECAVKMLKEQPDAKSMEEFQQEIEILKNADCPYIVKLFLAVEAPRLAIVLEFASRGSLFHVLNSELYDIGWDRILNISIDIVKGIEYLHNMPGCILHRDLKSLNILVTDAWEIKICDFGLSRLKSTASQSTLRKLRTTPAWSAPELMDEVEYSTKSDVYAIGMIVWECVHRCIMGKYERPFSEFTEIKQEFQILMQVKNEKRPTIPANCPDEIKQLLNIMWAGSPDARPHCSELMVTLNNLQQAYDNDEDVKLTWDGSVHKT